MYNTTSAHLEMQSNLKLFSMTLKRVLQVEIFVAIPTHFKVHFLL